MIATLAPSGIVKLTSSSALKEFCFFPYVFVIRFTSIIIPLDLFIHCITSHPTPHYLLPLIITTTRDVAKAAKQPKLLFFLMRLGPQVRCRFSQQEQTHIILRLALGMEWCANSLNENDHIEQNEANCTRQSKPAVKRIDIRKEQYNDNEDHD